MKQLTTKQKDLLEYIKDYIYENGRPPSQSEMAKKFNVSQNAMCFRVRYLVDKGYIEKDTTEKGHPLSRGIRVTGKEV